MVGKMSCDTCLSEDVRTIRGHYIVPGEDEDQLNMIVYHAPIYLEVQEPEAMLSPIPISWRICLNCGSLKSFIEENDLEGLREQFLFLEDEEEFLSNRSGGDPPVSTESEE